MRTSKNTGDDTDGITSLMICSQRICLPNFLLFEKMRDYHSLHNHLQGSLIL